MELRVVTTEKGKILVDESAKIREGDWFLRDFDNIITKANVNSDHKLYKSFKIIATINHSISLDVPMIIAENKVEKLAKGLYKEPLNKHGEARNRLVGQSDTLYGFRKFFKVFKIGFKAAQQKSYSEQDLIGFSKWIDKEELPFEDGSFVKYFNGKDNYLTVSQVMQMYIQSLKQEYIELEMEEYADEMPNIHRKLYRIKTNRVDGQLMAYVKEN